MATKKQDSPQQWPGGAVRISMSATVANDLATFKKGVAAFAEQVGCPECFSGFDCTFESERDFVIDAELDVTPTKVRTGPSISRGAAKREVTVPLSPSAEFDLKAILAKIDIFGRNLGPHWLQGGQAMCCSGFDMTFEREMQFTLDASDTVTPR
jgi:hypothetical protein